MKEFFFNKIKDLNSFILIQLKFSQRLILSIFQLPFKISRTLILPNLYILHTGRQAGRQGSQLLGWLVGRQVNCQVGWWLGRLVVRQVGWSVDQQVSCWAGRQAGRLVDRQGGRQLGRQEAGRLVGSSVSQSVSQSVRRLVSRSVGQWFGRSVSWSVGWLVSWLAKKVSPGCNKLHTQHRNVCQELCCAHQVSGSCTQLSILIYFYFLLFVFTQLSSLFGTLLFFYFCSLLT